MNASLFAAASQDTTEEDPKRGIGGNALNLPRFPVSSFSLSRFGYCHFPRSVRLVMTTGVFKNLTLRLSPTTVVQATCQQRCRAKGRVARTSVICRLPLGRLCCGSTNDQKCLFHEHRAHSSFSAYSTPISTKSQDLGLIGPYSLFDQKRIPTS